MFSDKKSQPQNRIDTLIGAGTKIQGDLKFSGGLRVDGHIKGNVEAAADTSSTLVLSEKAIIEGEIHVSHVILNGTVLGHVHSALTVELQSKSKVTGDIYYKSLEMQIGAVIDGKLIHEDSPEVRSLEYKNTFSGGMEGEPTT